VPLPDVLRALLTAKGPSGHETAPAAVWREAASAFAEVAVDRMGNSTARVAGTASGRSVAIFGHVDEIGLIVTHVESSGFLRFAGVGGWDPQILVGQRVVLTTTDGREVPGVIGKKPIHLLDADARKKVAEVKDLHIDLGVGDAEGVAALGVRIGDTAVVPGEPLELAGGRFASKSMDNRLGAFVAYEAARLVAEAGGAPGDVIGVANVQEEIGLNGARPVANTLLPDCAIVVDVTHATDAPGIEVGQMGEHELGSGPVIERGATLHPRLFALLEEAAAAEGIPVTLAGTAARTGTDADVVHFAGAGIPTTIVSIPLRYMHSPVEVVQVDDVLAVARLIAAFAQRLPADEAFLR
jgi:putative aminopeptidase FrvX